jgi:hypothetical protein
MYITIRKRRLKIIVKKGKLGVDKYTNRPYYNNIS